MPFRLGELREKQAAIKAKTINNKIKD